MKKTTKQNKTKKKTTSCEKWLLGGVLQKRFPKKLFKVHRKIHVLESLSNTVKGLCAVRLTTVLKRNPCTGILEPAVPKCSLK